MTGRERPLADIHYLQLGLVPCYVRRIVRSFPMPVAFLILLGACALMGIVAWRANATLPEGQLPMGHTDRPNTTRWLVLLQAPLMFVLALALVVARDAFEGRLSIRGALAPTPLLALSALMLVVQQAQLWGVRRIMRKHVP